MKTRFLLIYGYFIPILTSLIVSALPWLTGFIHYDEISFYFSNHSEVLFAYLAVMCTITVPFQSTIIHEENPHILAVLSKAGVRRVFIRASISQAILILFLALTLFLLSTKSDSSLIYGFIEILAFSLITFESIALISNGLVYGNIREKIILETNNAIQKNISQKIKP